MKCFSCDGKMHVDPDTSVGFRPCRTCGGSGVIEMKIITQLLLTEGMSVIPTDELQDLRLEVLKHEARLRGSDSQLGQLLMNEGLL